MNSAKFSGFSRLLILWCLLLVVRSDQLGPRKSVCQENNLCQASGVCYISAQRYKCKCPIDRRGDICEGTIDSCSLNPCKYQCQVANGFQFRCSNEPNSTYRYSSDLLGPIERPSSCDSYGLCLNGGRCYTGYRNPKSPIYKCVCPVGYAGLNCQLRHAFGHDSQEIFKTLKNDFEEKNKKTYYIDNYRKKRYEQSPNLYYYQQRFESLPYEYSFIEGFGKAFILLNTEVSEDLTISHIEFHAAKAGRFLISVSSFTFFD